MKLKIKNSKGEILSGILEGNSKNLIILCPGSRGNKNSDLLTYLSKRLNKNYSIFRFDFSGNGESEGLLEESTYLKDVSDIKSVVDHFSEKGYNILSIIGHSKGGTDVFLFTEKYPQKSKSIIVFAPRFNLFETQEYKQLNQNLNNFNKNNFYFYESKNKKHKITKTYISEIEKLGDLKKKLKLKNIPILIIHGDSDKTIPIEDSKEFISKFSKIKLKIISKEDHDFKNSIESKYLSEEINSWLSNLCE